MRKERDRENTDLSVERQLEIAYMGISLVGFAIYLIVKYL